MPGVGLVTGTGDPLLPERPIKTDPNDFAPRFGIAYRFKDSTVFRAGFGVFHALNTGGATLGSMTSTLPYFVNATLVSSNTTPQIFLNELFPTPDKVPGAVTSNQDLSRRTGYIYQYNFTIQHQLRPNLLLETGYLGNTGQKQVGTVWVNQPRLPENPAAPTPFAARSPYPNLSPVFSQNTNYQWSNYNAGYVKLEQRLSAGLSFSAAYTYSKAIDSGGAGQNMYDRRPERGLADNDVRHNFIGSWVYDLPLGKGRPVNISNSLLNAVAGGWQVNGIANFRSGTPYTISTANDIANVSTGGQRANATGVEPRKLDPRTNNLLGLDPAAYSTPARGQYGNLARNTQPGFGTNNWDFSAIKNFGISQLGEQSRLQLRFEWFNVFNHTQFFNPAATQNVPSQFGIVTCYSRSADPSNWSEALLVNKHAEFAS